MRQYLLDLDPLDRERDRCDDFFEPDLCECDLRERDLDLDLNNQLYVTPTNTCAIAITNNSASKMSEHLSNCFSEVHKEMKQ